MPYETDQRLKSYLDTNQLHREQMCRAVLAVDKRFSNVQPRHPRGGPDGGRDIEAIYRREQKAFGAVGFVNEANDSREQKTKIAAKFREDLASALGSEEKPSVFVFFTNINLTIGEKDELVQAAKDAGIQFCDVFDRERIRIQLDSPDGFYIRYQYLQIPLSDGEQASFFARWGDEIQSVVANGFQKIERSLDRILFLQEANDALGYLSIALEMDREYSGDEIGHFRAFALFHLKEIKHKIFTFKFGSWDRSSRLRESDGREIRPQLPGIKHGIGGGQWEQHVEVSRADDVKEAESVEDEGESVEDEDCDRYVNVGSFTSIGMNVIRFISIKYDKDSFIRFGPSLCLKDLDDAGFVLFVNKSLCEKIKAIHVIADGYKIDEFGREDFSIDESANPSLPVEFKAAELLDPWVRIRPSEMASNFTIRFSERTPKRLFAHRPARNSLPTRPSSGE